MFIEREDLGAQVQRAFEGKRLRQREGRQWEALIQRWEKWWSSVAELGGNLTHSPYAILTDEENTTYNRLLDQKTRYELSTKGDALFQNREYLPLTPEEQQTFDGLRSRLEEEMGSRKDSIFNGLDRIKGPTLKTVANSIMSDDTTRYLLIAHIFGEGYTNGTKEHLPFPHLLMNEIDLSFESLNRDFSPANIAGILYAAQFADERFIVAGSARYYHAAGAHWAASVLDLVEPEIKGLNPGLAYRVASNLYGVSEALLGIYKHSGSSPKASTIYDEVAQNLLRMYDSKSEFNNYELMDKIIFRRRLIQTNIETALVLNANADGVLQKKMYAFAEREKLPINPLVAGK